VSTTGYPIRERSGISPEKLFFNLDCGTFSGTQDNTPYAPDNTFAVSP
jgi:hypothetical protein